MFHPRNEHDMPFICTNGNLGLTESDAERTVKMLAEPSKPPE